MAYAIISLGGKQYRVQEGERLVVDRLPHDEGASFQIGTLLVGGDGETKLAPADVTVTARVVRHVLGKKIRIGKYRRRTGYRRHTGFRASLTQVEIETIGAERAATKPKAEEKPAPKTAEKAGPKAAEAPRGLPKGYADLTVAEVTEGSKTWNRPMLEAALAYEQAHGKRKGALGALEAAIAKKEEA